MVSTLDNWTWPEFIPFWRDAGLLVHLLVLLVFLALVFVLASRGIQAAWRRWSPAARGYRREVEYTAGVLSHGFVQYLGSLDAADVFRDTHISTLMRDWRVRDAALSRIIDKRISSMRDVLAGKQQDVWTPEERAEFGYRYRIPLEVLFSDTRREWMFQNAGLSFISSGMRYYPVLVNLGHTPSGLTALFHCEPYITLDFWKSALPVLASALDAPTVEVREVLGGEFLLSLNDVDRRDAEMKVLDEHRLQDRLGTAEERITRDSPGISAKDRVRKNELFARISQPGARDDDLLTADNLTGLQFTPSEAVRVLNAVFDYETAAWVVRNIGNYTMYSGEYLWSAIVTVQDADRETGRAGGLHRPRAGEVVIDDMSSPVMVEADSEPGVVDDFDDSPRRKKMFGRFRKSKDDHDDYYRDDDDYPMEPYPN